MASLAPTKDMEVVVIGSSLECADFQLLLYVGLRALVDRLGAATFNVGIFNISLDASGTESSEAAPLLARCPLTHCDVHSAVWLLLTGKPATVVTESGLHLLSVLCLPIILKSEQP